MALATYADLQTTISRYLKGRDDLTDQIQDFITLGEKRLNRELRVPEMISSTTLTAAASVALPSDFMEAELVELQTNPTRALEPMTPRQAAREYITSYNGRPASYTIKSGNLLLYPTPDDTYDIDLDYYATPAALADGQTTNSLFPAYADLYLYAALLEASPYLYDDERIPVWRMALANGIEAANTEAREKRAKSARVRPAYGAGC